MFKIVYDHLVSTTTDTNVGRVDLQTIFFWCTNNNEQRCKEIVFLFSGLRMSTEFKTLLEIGILFSLS